MEIQGSAADLMKLAMLHVYRRLRLSRLQTRMLLTVHDELVFEVPPDELKAVAKLVEEEMTQALPLEVPLEGGRGGGEELVGCGGVDGLFSDAWRSVIWVNRGPTIPWNRWLHATGNVPGNRRCNAAGTASGCRPLLVKRAGLDGPIEIWEIGGERFLYNGNHRFHAAVLAGVEIPPPGFGSSK